MNILLSGFVCPGCFNTFDRENGETIEDAFTHDKHRQELYCNRCGLVVRDPSITTFDTLEYLVERDYIFKTTDMFKEIKEEKKYIDSFELALKIRAREEAEERAKEEERARKREERKAKAKATREKNKKKKQSKKKKKKKKKKQK